MTRQPIRHALHDGLQLDLAGGSSPISVEGVPATVPGSVHTDLLAAGLIDDPYLDDNERLQTWIGAADWRYRTSFEWHDDEHDHADLVFEGLDTVAVVELNGQRILESVNMHRTYRVPVRELLRAGANELVVTFASAVKYADRASLDLEYRPHVNHHPYNAIRKMACSFGWDWGPDTSTAGIWRPITLHSWSGARLAEVRPLATVDGARGVVSTHVQLEGSTTDARTVRVRVGEAEASVVIAAGESAGVVTVAIEDVALWWPRGYGGQPLYDVRVELGDVGDIWTGRVGFRTVQLELPADEHGTGFEFVINGQVVFIKGANWIPDDAFPHRVTRERYAERIAQAEFADMNLLRVWGGGIFESDDFYELCDERGILTWQDFLFACAAYSEEEPMRSEVEAEARDNVVRLLPHPSLVLWNGNNENIWGFHDWGWEGRLEGRTWGLGYYTQLLPEIVAELDPHRPYAPGSPWSGDLDKHPNDPDHGSMHIWDLWNQRDYPEYRSYIPRFVAEFGWQGPPTWSTLTEAISDDPLTPESPGMLVHQKALGGNDKLTDGLVAHLPLPNTMEDWHWAMALNQAVAMRVGIEHFRSWSPRNSGTVIWQLNDCWPVTSWAAVDGNGRAKPLLHAVKQAYADRLVTIQPRDAGLAAIIVNDCGSALEGELLVRRLSFAGEELASVTIPVRADARGTVTLEIPSAVADAADASAELLVASLGEQRGLWYFAEYRDSALAEPHLTTTVDAVPGGYKVNVTTDVLVRDLTLLVDKVDPDAVVDRMLVTLLPGETTVFTVETTAALDPAAFAKSTVLRSANQLVAS